jgi:hypothetical protein
LVRAFEAVVLAFAAYAFFTTPLGRKTGWGHVKAIFSTAPAKEAAGEVPKALRRTLDRALARGRPGEHEFTQARRNELP